MGKIQNASHQEPLLLGALLGNEFCITLRNVSDDRRVVEAAVDALKKVSLYVFT